MKPKALTLLILSAIVIASVACGPSAKEQKELIQEQKTIMLCVDALERRSPVLLKVDQHRERAKQWPLLTNFDAGSIERGTKSAMASLAIAEKTLASIEKDINRYCK